jgi:hypothetical protein
MSNIAGKAYAMNVVTPVKPCWTWLQRLIFMAARAIPSSLMGLIHLSIIHFACWVVIRRKDWPVLDGHQPTDLDNDYVLFISNFNGTWDQYIDAFSDGIPSGLDLLWYGSTKYPHSIPLSPFKGYIVHNQIGTDYYYNATPGSAQRDIKAALRVMAQLRGLQEIHKSATAAEFAEAYRQAMVKIQNCLGSPGLAPVASLAAESADRKRRLYVMNAMVHSKTRA